MAGKDFIDIELERDELHRKFGGGIPVGTITLIEGRYGYGKSIICQRICYAALKHCATVSYISNELSTKDFINQMDSLNYDVTEFLLDMKLLFIPMFPLLGKVKFKRDLIDSLMRATKIFENDLIIIDTLSYLLVQENATEEKCFEIMKFFKRMSNLEKTIILTVDPENLSSDLLNLVRSMCDIHLELSQKSFGGEIKRIISVNRFKRSKKPVEQIIAFRVEPKVGLIIDISALV
ncbi:MAG: ATPase [Candidatus Altiarchaeales archaeon]|nr:MAG: ATPase [Candidatus Altiarchaeales archaeon]